MHMNVMHILESIPKFEIQNHTSSSEAKIKNNHIRGRYGFKA